MLESGEQQLASRERQLRESEKRHQEKEGIIKQNQHNYQQMKDTYDTQIQELHLQREQKELTIQALHNQVNKKVFTLTQQDTRMSSLQEELLEMKASRQGVVIELEREREVQMQLKQGIKATELDGQQRVYQIQVKLDALKADSIQKEEQRHALRRDMESLEDTL